jgi:hypothetical protein
MNFFNEFAALSRAESAEAKLAACVAAMEKIRHIVSEIPTIVCLCGSTRFSAAFHTANLQETLAGKIVLSIGCDTHSDESLGIDPQVKSMLDKLHFRKIELADEVLILNVDGYIGESTANELRHAESLGKVIRFLEPQRVECWRVQS